MKLLVFSLVVLVAVSHIPGLECSDAQDPASKALKDFFSSTKDLVRTVREEVKIVDDNQGGEVTGRGKKTKNAVIPLIVALKVSTVVTSFLMILKAMTLKSLLMSKLALLASIFFGVKYTYDKLHQPLYETTAYSAHPALWKAPLWQGAAWGGHDFGQGDLGHPGLASPDLQQHSATGLGSYDDLSGADLQSHYTNNVYQQTNYTSPKSTHRRSQFVQPAKYKTTVYKTVIKRS